MSRVDDLIAELCPDGVEYRALGELGVRNRGTSITAARMKELHIPNGEIRVFAGGATVADMSEGIIPERDVVRSPSIIIRSRGIIGVTHYDQPFTHKSELWSYTIKSKEVVQRFAYYYLLTQTERLQTIARSTSVKLPQLSVKDTDSLRIPIPPLEVQHEIVRILDAFTDLEAELEAELAARRKQYEHYRHYLLTKKHASSSRRIQLGQLGSVSMCKRIFKRDTTPDGDIPFFKIGTFGKQPDAYISQKLYEDYKSRFSFPEPGEVLISAAGTIGRAVVYDGKPSYFQDSNIVWVSNDESLVLNRFLKHWYQIIEWATDGGTIRRLYNDNIRRAWISAPPIEIQDQVANTLDKFDALVNDISIGLPAELEARRKQYEYYRDKLLTFEEKR